MADASPISAVELAQRLGGTLEGDGSRVICGVGTLEDAGPDMLSWLDSLDRLTRFKESRAGVFVVLTDCPAVADRTLIRVADPNLAMCAVLRWFGPPTPVVPPGVHPTAVVAPDARVEGAAIGPHVVVGAGAAIGAGTQLHAGVYVGADVQIGRDGTLWPNVVVRERVTIGHRVIIHPNATIGADGFGYLLREGRQVKIPQIGTVVIEDDVEIGAGTCIDRAKTGATRIGRGTKIDNLVQVGHNVTLGAGCIIVAQCGIAGSTALGRYVVLAGQVGLSDHLRIGDGVQVAAKSTVMHDVPAGKVYRGTPATDNMAFMRQQVCVRRLPKMMDEFRELVRRVERLESATDHRA